MPTIGKIEDIGLVEVASLSTTLYNKVISTSSMTVRKAIQQVEDGYTRRLLFVFNKGQFGVIDNALNNVGRILDEEPFPFRIVVLSGHNQQADCR